MEAALEAGNAVIVIATEPHRTSLIQRLRAHGADVVTAIEQRRYIFKLFIVCDQAGSFNCK